MPGLLTGLVCMCVCVCVSITGFLLDHCPALTELEVGVVYLTTDEYASRQWGLTHLCVDALGFDAPMLAYLPRSTAEGRLKVKDKNAPLFKAVRASTHIHTQPHNHTHTHTHKHTHTHSLLFLCSLIEP